MEDRWSAVAALSEPSRRALYDYVRRQDHPVDREEAAAATAMTRALAAFHLDKLVEAGLLSAHYAAPAGQPRGRGRTPKVYETTGDGLTVTIPERRYELIADILAEAVAGGEEPAAEAAARLAYRRGRDLSAVMPPGPDVLGALGALGFEPRADRGAVILHNCPFHALAARHTALVCGLNHAFLSGLVDGLGATGATPVLAPHPGRCCVELRGAGKAA
ncbi:helix-turn-helix transcriptional regulator [Paractinoplanes rhizophilus]|jgi:predicted ArsR family transcriptional regulator|uniref:Helix-turn-helix transcriptional regulator n=1 Tax=Paractinoplanes rhizophilus TaxID=1416877 RepID=A0ABW2HQ03_9ACTN